MRRKTLKSKQCLSCKLYDIISRVGFISFIVITTIILVFGCRSDWIILADIAVLPVTGLIAEIILMW